MNTADTGVMIGSIREMVAGAECGGNTAHLLCQNVVDLGLGARGLAIDISQTRNGYEKVDIGVPKARSRLSGSNKCGIWETGLTENYAGEVLHSSRGGILLGDR
jgi:hypothetical protein